MTFPPAEKYFNVPSELIYRCYLFSREELFSIAYELELDVVFGILVESKVFWNSDLAHAMPIHWNIDREGIMI